MKKLKLLILAACVGIGGIALTTNVNANKAKSIPVENRTQLVQSSSRNMTISRLEQIVREKGVNVRSGNGQLQFEYEGVTMAILSSQERDRMRIIAPITQKENLSAQEYENMLIANFHTTLDGRYAISNNLVFATFVHPLSSLHEDDLRSALFQVSQLYKNFGSSYSSGGLLFSPGASPQNPGEDPGPDLRI